MSCNFCVFNSLMTILCYSDSFTFSVIWIICWYKDLCLRAMSDIFPFLSNGYFLFLLQFCHILHRNPYLHGSSLSSLLMSVIFFSSTCYYRLLFSVRIKVLSNIDHVTPIPFGHFGIVLTSSYRQYLHLCREDLRKAIMTSWDIWRFPAIFF